MAGRASCEKCHGVGYAITQRGEYAHATACVCQMSCDRCGGRRFVITEQDGYEVAKPCSCAAIEKRVRLYNEAGIPARFARKSLSDYEAKRFNGRLKMKLLDYQRKFRLSEARGFLLAGAPGTGKTHLVTAVLHFLSLERGIACRFIDFFELTAQIRSTYGDNDKGISESSIIEPLVRVPVLAIDELGKGQGTAWELSIVDQLISRRYNAGRIVLATSNYFPERDQRARQATANRTHKSERVATSLEERVGSRIFSRLTEVSDIEILEGSDYRQRALG